jgi:ABC-type bacteriocin/lantibiotic exporter with double-glycine peptidase domain
MKMGLITLVRQEDDTGCGIACVAMLANKPYSRVKSDLYQKKHWAPHRKIIRTESEDLEDLLQRYNIDCEKFTFKDWEELKGVAILAVNAKNSVWHWVISLKTNNRFLIIDPSLAEVYQADVWKGDENDGYVAYKRKESLQIKSSKFDGIKI